ncbi:unnamed protein product (macronuclear) [Paramecium tetraurelia]|uniref:Uncharacterized protein n=1 Tax=Paramecium tetraurelia TaxID=5888 RepID=A0CGQ3_PARTE|nr:uncharacterized protein GSPATT00007410001 [Paramecium tetraurelia]CAK69970.1 unnamed protein product [Paramecium tetraurelia]|eukprot:XP_001437367.1 hypothetical protein (macronuclear) [Paramecium tetraurelia strain d4-2]
MFKTANFLKKIKDHEFNKHNYSMDDHEEIKKDLIIKISQDKKTIKFLKFLVNLTVLDERFIQCGSILFIYWNYGLKILELKIHSQQGLTWQHVTEVDLNLIIKLLNCKWRNLRINELNKFNDHSRRVNSVCFSPDGRSLASSGDDQSIHLQDVKTGKKKSIIISKGSVKSVCFSPKNNTLASSKEQYMYLWNLKKENKYLNQVIIHSRLIPSVFLLITELNPPSIKLTNLSLSLCKEEIKQSFFFYRNKENNANSTQKCRLNIFKTDKAKFTTQTHTSL